MKENPSEGPVIKVIVQSCDEDFQQRMILPPGWDWPVLLSGGGGRVVVASPCYRKQGSVFIPYLFELSADSVDSLRTMVIDKLCEFGSIAGFAGTALIHVRSHARIPKSGSFLYLIVFTISFTEDRAFASVKDDGSCEWIPRRVDSVDGERTRFFDLRSVMGTMIA